MKIRVSHCGTQEVDGEPRALCLNCWEDYQEFILGEAYLKQRELELRGSKAATKKAKENR